MKQPKKLFILLFHLFTCYFTASSVPSAAQDKHDTQDGQRGHGEKPQGRTQQLGMRQEDKEQEQLLAPPSTPCRATRVSD